MYVTKVYIGQIGRPYKYEIVGCCNTSRELIEKQRIETSSRTGENIMLKFSTYGGSDFYPIRCCPFCRAEARGIEEE